MNLTLTDIDSVILSLQYTDFGEEGTRLRLLEDFKEERLKILEHIAYYKDSKE